MVASTEVVEQRTERGLLGRGSASNVAQAWIVVTPRLVTDPAEAFPLPGESRGRSGGDSGVWWRPPRPWRE